MTSPTPWRRSSFMIAVPAAPAPETTTRTSASFLPTTRSALVSAASTQIAVPCWSSWKTGMSSSSRSRASISKHRGAAMSSRLIPPYAGAIARTTWMISSVSCVSSHTGEPLEQCGLALHDRQRGGRAQVAQAQHRRAVGDDRHGVPLDREPPGVLGILRDRQAYPRDAGGIGPRQLVPGTQRHLRVDFDLAAEMQEEGAVRDFPDLDPGHRLQRADHVVGVGGIGGVAGEVGDDVGRVRVDNVERGDDAAGFAHSGGESPDRGGVGDDGDPDGDRESGTGKTTYGHGVLL